MLHKAPAMPTFTSCSAIILINGDGSANVLVSGVDYGQGTYTALAQIAADELKLPLEKVRVPWDSDTDYTPYDWQTVASRFTVMGGNAVIEAARECLDQIRAVAGAGASTRRPSRSSASDGQVWVRGPARRRSSTTASSCSATPTPNGNSIGGPVIGQGRYIAQGLTNLDPETGQGLPALNWTYGAHGVELEVDTDTGAHPGAQASPRPSTSARCINVQQCRTQVIGGVVQGLGSAVSEKFVFDDGRLLNNSFADYKIPTAKDIPREMKQFFVETPHPQGPYGARGVAEHPMISVPGAVGNARGQRHRGRVLRAAARSGDASTWRSSARRRRSRAGEDRGTAWPGAGGARDRLRAGPQGLLPRLGAAHAPLAGAEGRSPGVEDAVGRDGHAAEPRRCSRAQGYGGAALAAAGAQRPRHRGAGRRADAPAAVEAELERLLAGASARPARPRSRARRRSRAAVRGAPGGQPRAHLRARRARGARGAPRPRAWAGTSCSSPTTSPLEDEVALKREAVERGLLLMGPDCGTAILNGKPLAFANVVRRGADRHRRRGRHRHPGGHVLHPPPRRRRLAGDRHRRARPLRRGGRADDAASASRRSPPIPATRVIVVVSKPPARRGGASRWSPRSPRRRQALRSCTSSAPSRAADDAARGVVLRRLARRRGRDGVPPGRGAPSRAGDAADAADRRRWSRALAARLAPGAALRGLFCGGTTGQEALALLDARRARGALEPAQERRRCAWTAPSRCRATCCSTSATTSSRAAGRTR